MKNLFKTLVLIMALALPFAATTRSAAAEPIKGQVVDVHGGAPVKWTLTAEYKGGDIFEVTFSGDIKDGYHGYPLSDMFSAPLFSFKNGTLVGDMRETEPTVEVTDEFGDVVAHYHHKMVFIQDVKAKAGETVEGTIDTNICTDATNQCKQSSFDFSIKLDIPAAVEAVTAPAATKEVATEEAADETVAEDVAAVEPAAPNANAWMVKGKSKGNVTELEFLYIVSAADVNGGYVAPEFTFGDREIEMIDADIDINAIAQNDTLRFKSMPFEANIGDTVKGQIIVANNSYDYEISVPDQSSAADAKLDWGSIITAILWGFAALLTPCVFPMVPMTVSFFIKGSQTPAQGRMRALLYGFFIVALYVLPIAVLIIISNVSGGENLTADIFNWLSTHWVPNLIFFLIFMIFAASFFGAFEITMPSKLVNKSDAGADKGGLLGIFFMALTLVLVSFSCTGPIVGTVLISSTQGGDVWMPIITMAAFALAFALPFTLLAWFPSMLKNMPKSGGWLNSVKVVLGFIEVALGLKFLMTADQTYHWGLLDREIYLAIWIVVFTLLGFYLLGKLRFAHDDKVEHISVKRLAMAIVVFAFVVYMIPGMFGAPLKGISGYLPPMSTQDYQVDGTVKNPNLNHKYGEFLHIPHNMKGYFDLDEAIAAAKEENKPIFVDVTGHACNNCREMENRVWSDSRVMQTMQDKYIICALYVDDKTGLAEADYFVNERGVVMKELGRKNAAIAMERWGVNAQPGYVLLTPDGEAMLMPNTIGYEPDINAFLNYLNGGLDNFNMGISYGNGEFTGTVTVAK